ncbi:MAG TPA: hypothetical protein DF613_14255 [Lachnospiraceae bacterium]|nr:hypothetical protein [Lachnospiraceae bacterium]
MIGGINRYPSNTFTGERKGASRQTKAPDFHDRLTGTVADSEKEMETFPVSRQDDQSAKEFVSKYQAALEQELSFRSRNPLENTVKEKERHILFTDESSSAFDSKTFLEILGVEPDAEFNWEAGSTGKLTESQIGYLKEKYDVENLSQNDFYRLLAELSGMNVISCEDVRNQFVRPGNPAAMEGGYVISAADPHFSLWMESGNNYLSRFKNEASMYEYFIQALMDGKSSVSDSDLFAVKAYYESQKEFAGTLAGIFEKIKRDGNSRETPPERQNGLELVSTNVPDTVREAWDRAEAEAGINGVAREADGKLSSITALFAQAMVKWYNEGSTDVLGSTEASAKEAVEKALDTLGIPQNAAQRKEKMFYEAFLRYL